MSKKHEQTSAEADKALRIGSVVRSTVMKIELDRDDLIREVKDNFYGDTDLLINLVSEGTATFEDMADVVKGIMHQMKVEGDFTNSDIAEMISDAE